MASRKPTRPMQAAIVVALLVAVVLIWVGAPRRSNVEPVAVIDSVTTMHTDTLKTDTVEKPRKKARKKAPKAPKKAPESRNYLDERVN